MAAGRERKQHQRDEEETEEWHMAHAVHQRDPYKAIPASRSHAKMKKASGKMAPFVGRCDPHAYPLEAP
jgi:hypothetical protein